jgi:hypothetical protein
VTVAGGGGPLGGGGVEYVTSTVFVAASNALAIACAIVSSVLAVLRNAAVSGAMTDAAPGMAVTTPLAGPPTNATGGLNQYAWIPDENAAATAAAAPMFEAKAPAKIPSIADLPAPVSIGKPGAAIAGLQYRSYSAAIFEAASAPLAG